MSEEMEKPVDDTEREFLLRAVAETAGLLPDPLRRNRHIAEETGGILPASRPLDEGHHVGGIIPFKPAAVQVLNPAVIGEEKAHLPGRGVFLPEDENGQIPDRAPIESDQPLFVPDLYPGH